MFSTNYKKCFAVVAIVMTVAVLNAAPEIEIPKTAVVPVLDGVADGVYINATVLPVGVMTEGFRNLTFSVTGENIPYYDAYAWAHLLWDDDNLYIFVRAIDDSLRYDTEARDDWYYGWTDDGLEIVIDPQNDKSAAWDDNDLKFWTPYHPLGLKFDRTPEGYDVAATGIRYAYAKSEEGINFEVVISFKDLGITGKKAGHKLGLDISYMDDDGFFTPAGHWFQAPASFMDCAVRWAGGVHDQPNTWGTLVLSGKTTNEKYPVAKLPAGTIPRIDGEIDEVWEIAFPAYHTWDGYLIDSTSYYGAEDASMIFKVLWDEDGLYVLAECVDDILFMDGKPSDWWYPWTDDMFEILIDSMNDKSEARDDNDLKFFIIPHTPNDPYIGNAPAFWQEGDLFVDGVFKQTENGYLIECFIPFAGLDVVPTAGTVMGFSCGMNEDDGQFAPPGHWFASFPVSFMCGKHEGGAYDEAKPSTWGEIILAENIDTHVAFDAPAPRDLTLLQNYPNPFNPTTTIQFSLPSAERFRLSIYNSAGQEAAVLLNDYLGEGSHRIEFDGRDLSSGVYFCRLESSSKVLTQKMLLIK